MLPPLVVDDRRDDCISDDEMGARERERSELRNGEDEKRV
jgi:hypothetical protein